MPANALAQLEHIYRLVALVLHFAERIIRKQKYYRHHYGKEKDRAIKESHVIVRTLFYLHKSIVYAAKIQTIAISSKKHLHKAACIYKKEIKCLQVTVIITKFAV